MEKNKLEKSGFHANNKHKNAYDFEELIKVLPALDVFVIKNKYGNLSIDFANALAVKSLNQALLIYFYGIKEWDIPEGYLCPPIPSRAEYIHQIADVINESTSKKPNEIKVLDIGVGANCIYPLIGQHEYQWNFVGSDIDEQALSSAQKIIDKNHGLSSKIELRFQPNKEFIFINVIQKQDFFDFTICNPPFHASADEAYGANASKRHNLGNNKNTDLNFGGQNNELWYSGGEINFLAKMIAESVEFKNQSHWFSSLVSKIENVAKIYKILNKHKPTEIRNLPIILGNKVSRIICWKF